MAAACPRSATPSLADCGQWQVSSSHIWLACMHGHACGMHARHPVLPMASPMPQACSRVSSDASNTGWLIRMGRQQLAAAEVAAMVIGDVPRATAHGGVGRDGRGCREAAAMWRQRQ